MTTVSREQRVAASLRTLLQGKRIGSDLLNDEHAWNARRDFEASLEFYLPEVLAAIYREWERESLDGFYFTVGKRRGEFEAEFFGLCLIISDQTLTPIHVCLAIAADRDEVTWLACRLGERDGKDMVRIPYHLKNVGDKRVLALDGRADSIDWVYKAELGGRNRCE
jgi:hypothetical protein